MRTSRPVAEKIADDRPFVTDYSVIECLSPDAEGGMCQISTTFESWKISISQALFEDTNSDLIIDDCCDAYENEMMEMLMEFPQPIMETDQSS
jgi:vacuolar-type H+-ATPase catalytic subunit A/Vma1